VFHFDLHRRALEHDSHAQYELVLRYETDAMDVNADPAKALSWLTKAAENGCEKATRNISPFPFIPAGSKN